MNRRFSIKKTALFLIVLIILIVIGFLTIYKFNTSSVSNDTKPVTIEVNTGDNYFTMAKKLKEKNLIKSEFFYKLFLKLHKPGKLVVGQYDVNKAMSVSEIVETIGNENNLKTTRIKLTFKEGINVIKMASIIEDKTDIKKEEFLNKINDETFIDTLINKYWFLTDEVKTNGIYYDLEGYFYPDTYIYEKDQISLESLINSMLENTGKKLAPLKEDLEKNQYTIHQILTLASLIELEAVSDNDRATVAGVFYNRLNNNWTLGSDVTTYYSAKKSMTERLTKAELDACNGYNTRCSTMKGLPVGPIDNPAISSIKAAINPIDTDYYYFVADSEKKVYFTKNANEHAAIIAKLKKEGKWIG